jgi:HSP20 family protein
MHAKGGLRTVAHWNFSRRLLAMRNAIYRFCKACMGEGMERRGVRRSGVWSPAVDLYETDDALILKAELAGFLEANVNIEIKDRALLLQGSRPRQHEVNEERYHCLEWATGAFQRCFVLPARVDAENMSASYHDGVFTLRLPKTSHMTLDHYPNAVSRQSNEFSTKLMKVRKGHVVNPGERASL